MTALAIQTTAALSAITAETALAAYEIALQTGRPAAYETAAHALASALRVSEARRRHAPRPAPGSRPVLAVVNGVDPDAQSAPARPKRQSASRPADGPDLDARPTAVPRNKRASGAFLIVWADGSCLRVSAVPYHAGKPEGRWASAYQVANRLRRRRQSEALKADLARTSDLRGASRTLSGGIVTESDDWRAYLAAVPLPALKAIHCENTGEAFDAPAGSAFGGGDRAEADRLAQAMTVPLIANDSKGGWRSMMSRHSREALIIGAFADLEDAAPPPPAPVPGEAVGDRPARDVDGREIVFCEETAEAAADAATAKAERARAAYEAALPAEKEPTGYHAAQEWRERHAETLACAAALREAWDALRVPAQRIRDALGGLRSLRGKTWTCRIDPTGRYARFLRPGFGASAPVEALAALRFVQP